MTSDVEVGLHRNPGAATRSFDGETNVKDQLRDATGYFLGVLESLVGEYISVSSLP